MAQTFIRIIDSVNESMLNSFQTFVQNRDKKAFARREAARKGATGFSGWYYQRQRFGMKCLGDFLETSARWEYPRHIVDPRMPQDSIIMFKHFLVQEKKLAQVKKELGPEGRRIARGLDRTNIRDSHFYLNSRYTIYQQKYLKAFVYLIPLYSYYLYTTYSHGEFRREPGFLFFHPIAPWEPQKYHSPVRLFQRFFCMVSLLPIITSLRNQPHRAAFWIFLDLAILMLPSKRPYLPGESNPALKPYDHAEAQMRKMIAGEPLGHHFEAELE